MLVLPGAPSTVDSRTSPYVSGWSLHIFRTNCFSKLFLLLYVALGMCFPTGTVKRDHFWKKKGLWEGRRCLISAMGLQLLPVWQCGSSPLLERVSQSPNSEGELKAGYISVLVSHLGRQFYRLLAETDVSRNAVVQVKRCRICRNFQGISVFFIRNLHEITPLGKTPCFSFLAFSFLSPFHCIPVCGCYSLS